MLSAVMTSQGLANPVGGNQTSLNAANQFAGMTGCATMGLNNNGLINPLAGMNMGLNASSLMQQQQQQLAATGLNSGGSLDALGGGLSVSAGAGITGLGTPGMLTPAQQFLQQRMQLSAGAPSHAQMMMMMNMSRNSMGQPTPNPAALNALLQSNMNSIIPTAAVNANSNVAAGINPTMPPPNMNNVIRSSFSSGTNGINSSGSDGIMCNPMNDAFGSGGGKGGSGNGDLSLSPTSFQW